MSLKSGVTEMKSHRFLVKENIHKNSKPFTTQKNKWYSERGYLSLVNRDGLKIRSRRGSRVQIPPLAFFKTYALLNDFLEGFGPKIHHKPCSPDAG